MVRIARPLTPDWQRANARAAQNAARGLRAVRIAERIYRVPSAHDASGYTVEIDSIIRLEARCTCPHGSRGDAKGVCWHKAAALFAAIRRIADLERGSRPSAAEVMARFGKP